MSQSDDENTKKRRCSWPSDTRNGKVAIQYKLANLAKDQV